MSFATTLSFHFVATKDTHVLARWPLKIENAPCLSCATSKVAVSPSFTSCGNVE